MRWHTLLLCGLIGSAALAQSNEETDSARLPAEKMPLADESLLLDAVDTSQRTVIVGERGHVLLSEDRNQWRQAEVVPTRSTLTAVTAVGEELWAVGHDEVIIHSSDGGQTWELQHADPAQSAEDDPNPLLDVLFMDAERGIAVGAYGRILFTDDGGATWSGELIGDLIDGGGSGADDDAESTEEPSGAEEELEADDESAADEQELADAEELEDDEVVDEYLDDFEEFQDEYYDYHLNAIVRLSDGSLFIAAEAGNGYRSTDGGQSWTRVEFPYQGSMFDVLALEDDTLVAYGLRGNVFVSRDQARSWTGVQTDTQNSLMGGTVLEDGSIVLVGANGEVLLGPSAEGPFRSWRHPDGNDLANAIALSGRTLLLVGEEGITDYTPGGSQ